MISEPVYILLMF